MGGQVGDDRTLLHAHSGDVDREHRLILISPQEGQLPPGVLCSTSPHRVLEQELGSWREATSRCTRFHEAQDLDLMLFDDNLDLRVSPAIRTVLHYDASSHWFSAEHLQYLFIYEAVPQAVWDPFLDLSVRGRVKTLELIYSMENILSRPTYYAVNGAPATRYFELRVQWDWKN